MVPSGAHGILNLICPACGTKNQARVVDIGKRGRCACGEVFPIERPESELVLTGMRTDIEKSRILCRSANRSWFAWFAGAILAAQVLLIAIWRIPLQSPAARNAAIPKPVAAQPRIRGNGGAQPAMPPAAIPNNAVPAAAPNAPAAKASLFAISEKFDGKEAERLKFWIDYRDAGHGSWMELDFMIDGAGSLFDLRKMSEVPTILSLSEETKAAYHHWRSVRVTEQTNQLPEPVARAKARVMKAVDFWKDNNHSLLTWYNEIENGVPFDDWTAYNFRKSHGISPETTSAVEAWAKSIAADQGKAVKKKVPLPAGEGRPVKKKVPLPPEAEKIDPTIKNFTDDARAIDKELEKFKAPATADSEPELTGLDKKCVDASRLYMKKHPRIFFYVCEDSPREQVLRATRMRYTFVPSGRHPEQPAQPLNDVALSFYGGKPSDEAVQKLVEMCHAHNAAIKIKKSR